MHQWDEQTLEAMRTSGDPLADETVLALESFGEGGLRRFFKQWGVGHGSQQDSGAFLAAAPEPLRRFIEATSELPAETDLQRIEKGDDLFLGNATLVALGLLTRSLPAGYAAPRLAKILHLTGNLERHPYRRVLAVLQFLVNISSSKAFAPGGLAVLTAQKMRLLHAGMRLWVRRHPEAFSQDRFGIPVSQLDLAFTITTFSYHVVEALKSFGVDPDPSLAEDYHYLWRVYGQMQGIRPEWIPVSLKDAQAFANAYGSRHFASATENQEGVLLTQADLRMMRDLLPVWLRPFGFGALPELMMARQLGPEAAHRVGVRRHPGHAVLEGLLLVAPKVWHRLWATLTPDHRVHDAVSRLFFKALIRNAWGGEVTFEIPYTRLGIKELA
jgi:hypothetical protein